MIQLFDKFSYVKKGYDPTQVDEYIEKMEEILKSYKQKDNAINNAIISAQVAADNIICEANVKANQMLSQTQEKLEQMQSILTQQKNIIDSFNNDYKALVRKYLSNIDENDMFKMYSKINSLEEKINSLKAKPISEDIPKVSNNSDESSSDTENG